MNQYLLINSCRVLLLCIALSHTTSTVHAQYKKARVLFIGNSYTYGNDLPGLVKEAAASTGDTLEYDMSAPGGAGFGAHVDPRFTDIYTLKKLRAGGWDYVVLQEQSLIIASEPYLYYGYSFASGKQLVDSVRRYNPCAEIIFYMTWGRKKGLAAYCDYTPWPYSCTYPTMDSVIRARYLEITYFTKSTVSPVGAVWRYIRTHYPAVDLYDPDESHPSLAGSYAGACSFYTAIFKKPASTIRYNASLPAAIAANIRTAASKVVYDSLSTWHIGKTETVAGFNHHVQGRRVVSLSNQSLNAREYKWDLGDGQTSTAINPIHTYPSSGVYTVRLIATGKSCSDTAYARVHATNDPNAALFTIAPNPVADKLYITSGSFGQDNYRLQLLNSQGQVVYEQQASNAPVQSITVSGLPGGMYTLNICNSRQVYYKKIIIR
jgi:hypothetical protein